MDLRHTIESGDTLIKLAAKSGTTVDELAILNDIKDPDSIQVGQRIVLKRIEEQGNSLARQADERAGQIAADNEAASKATALEAEKRRIAAETEDRSRVEAKKVKASSILGPIQGPSQLAVGFYDVLRSSLEGDHGSIPKPTNDSTEGNLSEEDRSLDIGYGHKLKKSELDSGTIYGIPFQNLKTGEYIPLTDSEKRIIQKEDIEANVNLARKTGWDSTLKSIGISYESLAEPYRLVLSDLAYNVGGKTAGLEWKGIFSAMKAGNTKEIVGHLRRKDNEKNTPGMDNRAAKAAYAAGLIKTLQEAKDAGLVLANTKEIPLR